MFLIKFIFFIMMYTEYNNKHCKYYKKKVHSDFYNIIFISVILFGILQTPKRFLLFKKAVIRPVMEICVWVCHFPLFKSGDQTNFNNKETYKTKLIIKPIFCRSILDTRFIFQIVAFFFLFYFPSYFKLLSFHPFIVPGALPFVSLILEAHLRVGACKVIEYNHNPSNWLLN